MGASAAKYRRPDARVTSNGSPIYQVPNALGSFGEMSTTKSPGPDGGLVVCRVDVIGRFDTFRDADVTVRLKLGSRLIHFHGPEDSDTVAFSIPNADFRKGETFELHALDRDVLTMESIATVTAPLDGTMPLALNHDKLRVECRAWTKTEVAEKARAKQTQITAAIARARSARPMPGAPEWGRAASGIKEAWAEVDHLLGLVGAADERIAAAETELRAIEDRFSEAANKSVAMELARLPPVVAKKPVVMAEVSAIVEKVTCDARLVQKYAANAPFLGVNDPTTLPPCFVQLQVTRTSRSDLLFLFPGSYVSAVLVRTDGTEVGTTELAVLDEAGNPLDTANPNIKTGQKYSVFLLPNTNVAIGTKVGAAPASEANAVMIRFTRVAKADASALARLDTER